MAGTSFASGKRNGFVKRAEHHSNTQRNIHRIKNANFYPYPGILRKESKKKANLKRNPFRACNAVLFIVFMRRHSCRYTIYASYGLE